MKSIKIIIILSLFSICLKGQNSLSLDVGFLYSKINTTVERTDPPPPERDDNFRTSYRLGFLYEIPISSIRKVSIKTGLNFMRYGTNNYNARDEFLESDLRTSFLVLPIGVSYKLNKKFYVDALYHLNYSVRRNQNIIALRAGEFPTEDSYIYNNFSHGIEFGIGYASKGINISIRHSRSISKLWDSKDFFNAENARWYGTITGFSISIGKYISENE